MVPVQPTTSRCFISLHPWYVGFDPARVCSCMAEIRDLGAGGLRTDIRWQDILPDGMHIDRSAVEWYRSFLLAARDCYGLRTLVVLSNPPEAVLRFAAEERLKRWQDYIAIVMNHFSDVCQSYQVMNELNNPVYQFVNHRKVPDAVRFAAKIIRARLPRAEISINVLCDMWRWRQALRWYLHELPDVIDVIGLDFYPETWAVSLRDPWSTLKNDLRELVGGANAGLNPRVAIMETGYSTNIPFVRDEPQQVAYYRKLGRILHGVDHLGKGQSLAFVSLYELCDANTNAVLDPEAHFGILRSQPWRRKASFAEVQQLCGMFS